MANVIVTGAFGTLGRAIIKELTARGYQVAAFDIAAQTEALTAALVLGEVDLTDEHMVRDAVSTAARQFGKIHALINVAGGFVWEKFEGGSLSTWDQMYRTNLLTAVVSSLAVVPYLLINGGAIVNVGAAAAARPQPGMAAYAASKSGVRALTESLAEELRGRGVRVNVVLPSIIDTEVNRTSMPDADTSAWVRPEAAAKAVAFLISNDASAITGASITLSSAS